MAIYIIRDYVTGNTFECHQDDYILIAAENAGLSYNYNSRSGMESSTIAKVITGDCEVEETGFLSPEARAAGFILIDVARPKTNCVIKFEAYAEWTMFEMSPPPVYEF